MESQPSKSRLRHQPRQEQTAEQHSTQREFASVEELLRHDASQVTPPPAIAERLKATLEDQPPSPVNNSWWRRFFGR